MRACLIEDYGTYRAHFALVAEESTLPVVVDSCIQVAGSAGVSLGGAVVGGDWNVNDM
jgi:hypothetical protein